MPEEDFQAAIAALNVDPHLDAHDAHLVVSDPLRMARLIGLVADAARLVRERPEVAERQAAAQALRGAVQTALLACLATGREEPPRRALHKARALARQLAALGREQPEALLAVADIAARLGVPATTLNAASQEMLGMSTLHYARQVRMDRVRQVLQRGEAATVTEVATQYGFWELGRFAMVYQARYGEKPSDTLRQGRRW